MTRPEEDKSVPDAIPADIYTREYFLHHRAGAEVFLESGGAVLCESHAYGLELAGIRPGEVVLDAGCGCGEIAFHAAKNAGRVVGIDYAQASVDLANEALVKFDAAIRGKVSFHCVDLLNQEPPGGPFDVVFFMDVIEHIPRKQVPAILQRLHDSLKPGGRMIVHTWPNRWHLEYVYPLTYAVSLVIGNKKPRNPRDKYDQVVHVAEQSLLELHRNMKRAGFSGVKTFVRQPEAPVRNLADKLYHVLHTLPPFSWVYCDHLWSVGTRLYKG